MRRKRTASPSGERATVLQALESDSASRTTPEGSTPGATTKYRIEAELGSGGVGVVYRGQDAYLNREVALKFLKPRYQDDDAIVMRFLEEAQIGGQLQHPGIVPVHDIGMADGKLFFAMKIVRGQALSELLLDREPSRLLSIFEAVCQTVAYAHAQGVIHRDLKPQNVMVGEFGEVQVVDWGMAKVLGNTAPTTDLPVATSRSGSATHTAQSQAGAIMGTLEYMPPEQARGELDQLDERADVFALGAVLLEILTGQPPYRGASTTQARIEQARTCDLADAWQRLAACTADPPLVALCRSCLQANPDDRPRSARVLAETISSHRADVEQRAQAARIDAARAEVQLQAERRARKLTAGLAAAGVFILSLLGGGWAWLAWSARTRADATDGKILTHLARAATAERASDWTAAVAAVDAARALASTGDGTPRIRNRATREHATILARATAVRQAAVRDRANRELIRKLEEVRQPEGVRYYPVDWANVAAIYRQTFADDDLDLLAGTEAAAIHRCRDRGIPVELSACIDSWVQACTGAREEEDAARLIRIADAIDANPDRRELRKALRTKETGRLREFANRPDLTEQPSVTLHLLGQALRVRGALRTALRVYQRAQAVHRDDFALTFGLARTLHAQFPLRAEAAVRMYSAALALRPESVEVRHELGNLLAKNLGDKEAARRLFEESVARAPEDPHLAWHLALTSGSDPEKLLRAARKAVELAPKSAAAHRTLAGVLARRRAYAEAEASFRKAIQLRPQFLDAEVSFASTLGAQGKLKEAEKVLSAVIARIERDGSKAAGQSGVQEYDRRQRANAYLILADVRAEQRRNKTALELYRKAASVDPTWGRPHFNIGFLLRMGGAPKAALLACRTAVRLAPKDTEARLELANSLNALGQRSEAIEELRHAVQLAPRVPRYHLNLANSLQNAKRYTAAAAAYQAAIRLRPNYTQALYSYGMMLMRRSNSELAVQHLRKVTQLDPKDASAWCNLAFAYSRWGRNRTALPLMEKGHALGKGWRQPSARWIEQIRVKADVEPRLLEVIGRQGRTATPQEITDAAVLALQRGEFAASVRLWKEIERLAPDRMRALANGYRIDAACAAVMAARSTENAGDYRSDALQWLRSEVRRWPDAIQQPTDRQHVQRIARTLFDHPWLDDVRKPAQLPKNEGPAWTEFWQGARALRSKLAK